MILPITDDWRINSDRHQWIIEQRHVSEGDKHKGKEYWQPKGYYTSIEAAIFELHQLRLRLSNVEGVVEGHERGETAGTRDTRRPEPQIQTGGELMNIAQHMKPELDRTDTLECVLDNILNRCHDAECRKAVLRHYAGGVARAERQRIRRELDDYAEGILSQAEEQREESMKLVQTAQEIQAMLDLPCLRGGEHEN